MQNKLKYFLLALISGIMLIAGCGKNTPSIVGTWTYKTHRSIFKINGTLKHDTTENIPSGSTFAFTTQGKYFTTGTFTNDSGTYSLNNNILTCIGSNSVTTVVYVNTLTDHTLDLEERDTSQSSPYETAQYIFGFSR